MSSEIIRIEQVYPVSTKTVWQAITEPAKMRKWYFPMMEDFKPEPGFTTRFDVEAGLKRYGHIWTIEEVVPGKKISYDWRYEGYPGNSLVTFELYPEGEKTRLVFTHDRLESFEGKIYPELAKENFVQGWTMFLGTALKLYLEKTAGPSGQTGMLIRKPAAQVFEAFVDASTTTKFWFTHSTGRLAQDAEVTWTWSTYNHQTKVLVKTYIPEHKLVIEWGEDESHRSGVEWRFEAMGEDKTFVEIEMWGFMGDRDLVWKQITDSVGGFCWVLAGAKAWLEHGIQLNLVGDRFPK